MGIKSELHEAILKRGGKVPPYGGIAAAMDELNKLPGGGGDCDWNTMKNRPFGTEYGTIEVLGETTVETDEDGGFAAVVSTSVEVGKKYSVIWNGSEYEVTAKVMDTGDQVLAVLGNMLAAGGTDTGEPFFIGCADASLFGYALDGSTSVTISIHTEGEIVKQIDPKYIPGGSGGVTVTTLYYAGAETEFLWMNPDDVGNESKKLTYEDALKLKDHILRFCMIYGENIITYTGKEFSHYPEEKYVFIDVNADGVSFNIRG